MTTEAEALVLAASAYTTVTGLSGSSNTLSVFVQVAYHESAYGDFWTDRGQPAVFNVGMLIANADWIAAYPTAVLSWENGIRLYRTGPTGIYTAKFRTYASIDLGWQALIANMLTWKSAPMIQAGTRPIQVTPKDGTPCFSAENLYLIYQAP